MERPEHMVHLDVKKTGRIPDGGGWRAHGRDSAEARAVARTKERGTRTGYVYLHSAIDGHTRLAYTEALENEQAATAIAFLGRAREWFAKHGITKIERIITDNGACYRAQAFAAALGGSQHRRTTPYTPKHNGKVERYNRILAEEFLYARTWNSETEGARDMEPTLQLPPAPRSPRWKAARVRNTTARQQRPGLIQLAHLRRRGLGAALIWLESSPQTDELVHRHRQLAFRSRSRPFGPTLSVAGDLRLHAATPTTATVTFSRFSATATGIGV